MFFIDTWWDVWRLVLFLLNLLCIVWLIGGYVRQAEEWNNKSMQMWYSRIMWSVTGCALTFEGIQNNRAWSYTLGFVTVASITSFSALYRRGEWGYKP